MEYVYLLQEREFVKSNEQIYKIGRTKQLNFARFRQYPKNSISFFQSYCDDCIACENKIVKVFSKKYKKRIDVGQEYFEGNVFDMIIQISIIVQNNLQDKIDRMYHEKNDMKLDNEMNTEFSINQKHVLTLVKRKQEKKKTRESEETEKKVEVDIDAVVNAGADAEVEMKAEIETKAETKTKPETKTEAETKTKPGNIITFFISLLWHHFFKK